jgi:hypothetical protein
MRGSRLSSRSPKRIKIILELPEWATENSQNIYVFSANELVAKKEAKIGEDRKIVYGPLEVKTVRCNRCGECCMDNDELFPFGAKPNGECSELKFSPVEKYSCGLKGMIPLGCAKGRGTKQQCIVEFVAVE